MEPEPKKIKLETGCNCNAPMPEEKVHLPFFVDRTGTIGTDATLEAAPVAIESLNLGENVGVIESNTNEVEKSLNAAAVATSSARRRRRKQRKRVQYRDDKGGESADADAGTSIRDMIHGAKRRVIDKLRELADKQEDQTKASTAGASGISKEMKLLKSINQQLASSIIKGEQNLDNELIQAADSNEDEDDGSGITLGVKSTAHHAPAFNRVHRRDLTEFLVDMKPDKDLWRVDLEDLQPKKQRVLQSPTVSTSTSPNQPVQQPIDPMQTECSVCLKRGHLTESCTRTGPVCILCGREGHPKTNCPDRLCPLCLAAEHGSDTCHRYGLLTRSPCDRCGILGHWKDQCPEIWRQYHSTVTPGQAPMQSPRDVQQQDLKPSHCVPSQSTSSAAAAAASYETDDEDQQQTKSVKLSIDDLVGQISPFAFCCNCAQSGHLVHQCSQPRGSLNKGVGSFQSQLVGRYDSTDNFSPDRFKVTAAAAVAVAAAAGTSGGSGINNCTSFLGSKDNEDDPTRSQRNRAQQLPIEHREAASTSSGRSAPIIGESFIPLWPQYEQKQQHQRHPRNFKAELEQLRAMARQFLPEGSSRSQVKKLANRLGYWRRHGYQPSTPEEEAHMAQRMEAWVLEVADSHNQLHKLNFKRRCRLLNSTGAALEVIRSCRQFSEQQPDCPNRPGNRKNKRKKNKQQQHVNQRESDLVTPETSKLSIDSNNRKQISPTGTKKSVKKVKTPKATAEATGSTGEGVWSGRLRSSSHRPPSELKPINSETPRRKIKQEK